MSKRPHMAASFAHLLGLGMKKAEDEEDRKAKHAEEDDDDQKKDARRAEKDDDDDDKNSDARRAEDEDDDEGEDDKEKSRKSRKAKGKRAEDGDDDDDDDDDADAEEDDDEDEMRGKSAAAKARGRERARCAAIFACKGAGRRPDVAATLAFSTNMGRREAIKVLSAVAAGESVPSGQQASKSNSLDRRMSSLRVPYAGADSGSDIPAGMSPVAAAIIAAGKKSGAQ